MKINTYDKSIGGGYQLQVVAEWVSLAGGTITNYTMQDADEATVTIVMNGVLLDPLPLPYIVGRWEPEHYNPLKALTEGILKACNMWEVDTAPFVWRVHQVGEARELANMLLTYGLGILQHMPRTGKTGTTLLALHHIQGLAGRRLRVLVSTTTNGLRGRGWKKGKKPDGWYGFIEATYDAGFCHGVDIVLTTPYRLKKVDKHLPAGMTAPSAGKWDVILIDESHKIFSTTDPKDTAMFMEMRYMCMGAIVCLVTATPHAQSLHQMYRQFTLAGGNSPFAKSAEEAGVGIHTKALLSFEEYFSVYGEPKTMIIGGGRAVPVYTEPKLDFSENELGTAYVLPIIDRYRMDLSQGDVGIEDGMLPVDRKVLIPLSHREQEWIDGLRRDSHIMVDGVLVQPLNDRHIEIMINQIEGGTLKFKDEFSTLDPNSGLKMRGVKASEYNWEVSPTVPSKIAWIMEEFGDNANTVIMYHFTNERKLLLKYFKNATILQSKTNAEGIDLYMFEHMVIYSSDWSVATYIQRRDRQVHMTKRDTPIIVTYTCSKGLPSEDIYTSVVEKGEDLTFAFYNKGR